MRKTIPLSLVVITKNEEANIERCLRSVPFASEMVIVDSFSEDKTVEKAKALGAKVFQEPWQGYGPQKKRASELATNDWILSLDADEALSPELAAEIEARFSTLDPQCGYLLPRLSFHLGRWIRHGGWYPDYQLKLFHRRHSGYGQSQIHEKVQSSKEDKMQSDVHHWVFDDLSDQVRTNDRYSTLQAQDHFRRGEKFSLVKLLMRPYGKFLECYFWKRGFLDGLPGFLIAVSAAYSMFLRYGKLWELERKDKR